MAVAVILGNRGDRIAWRSSTFEEHNPTLLRFPPLPSARPSTAHHHLHHHTFLNPTLVVRLQQPRSSILRFCHKPCLPALCGDSSRRPLACASPRNPQWRNNQANIELTAVPLSPEHCSQLPLHQARWYALPPRSRSAHPCAPLTSCLLAKVWANQPLRAKEASPHISSKYPVIVRN